MKGSFFFQTQFSSYQILILLICSLLNLQTYASFCSTTIPTLPPCSGPELFTIPSVLDNGEITLDTFNIKPISQFVRGPGPDFKCFVNNIPSNVCDQFVLNNQTHKVNCTSSFQLQYGCSGTTSSCLCDTGVVLRTFFRSDTNTEITFGPMVTFGIEDEISFSTFSGTYLDPTGEYSISYDSKEQKVIATGPAGYRLRIRSGVCYYDKISRSIKKTIKLSDCLRKSVQPMKVSILDGTELILNRTYEIKNIDLCDNFPEFFKNLKSFNCRSDSHKAGYIIAMIGICISMIAGLIIIAMAIAYVAKKLYCALKKWRNKKKTTTMLGEEEEMKQSNKKGFWQRMKDKWEVKMTKTSDERMLDETPDAEFTLRDTVRKRSPGPKVGLGFRQAPIMVFFLIFLAVNNVTETEACDLTVYTDSSVTSCVINPSTGLKDCSPNQLITVDFPFPGSTVCFNIQSDTNETLSSITVTDEGNEVCVDSIEEYYTGDWKEETETVLHCKATSECDTGTCSTIDYSADKTMGGIITNMYCVSYPSVGQCEVYETADPFTCGSALNCYFSCFALDPVLTGSRLRQRSGFKQRIYIRSCQDGDCSDTSYDVGQSASIGDIQITFNGMESGFISDLIPDYWTHFNETHFMGAALKGSPAAGSRGDVQSNFPWSSTNTDFIFDLDIVINRALNDPSNTIAYTFHKSGWTTNDNSSWDYSMPFNGDFWSFDADRNMACTNTSSVANASVSVLFGPGFIITEEVETSCPDVEDVGAILGCYDCDNGASFNVSALSRCSEGSANLVCDDIDIANPHIQLTLEEQEFKFYFHSEEKNINTVCHLGDSDFDLVGMLQEPPDFKNDTDSEGQDNGEKYEGSCQGDFIVKTLSGCGSFWDILGTVLVFILIAIGIMILLYIAFIVLMAMLSWISTKKKMRSMKKMLSNPRKQSLSKKLNDGTITNEEIEELAKL